MDNLHLNLLPFKPLFPLTTFSFYRDETPDSTAIYQNQLPIGITVPLADKFVFWKEGKDENAPVHEAIDLYKSKNFAKSYFKKIVHDFFSERGLLLKYTFINDTEVWLQVEPKFKGFNAYKKFTIKVDNSRLVSDFALLISFDGYSNISNQSLANLALEPEQLSTVLYKGLIRKYRLLSEEERSDKESIFPVLNKQIQKSQGISYKDFNKNKYKRYFLEVSSFIDTFLNTSEAIPKLSLVSAGFLKLNSNLIDRTTEDSNLLLFGNNNSHFNPYQGIKEFGPYEKPRNQNIRFIFIFHEDDKEVANKLYAYLKKGYKSFLGLNSFIRIQFEVDTANSILYSDNDNPIQQIKSELKKRRFDEQYQYAAIYISRIKKDGLDDQKDIQYYRIKEELLRYRITSQVIYRENIFNELFNFYLPNIAIALLAKLGGVPWRLKRPIKKDLVIGIGAYRDFDADRTYIGNAFCFQNDGRFIAFDCFESSNATSLAESIGVSIDQFTRENQSPSRVIIHFYKDVSRDDLAPIKSVLEGLRLSVPVIIITIFKTESRDYVVFDYSYDGVMPASGIIVKLSKTEYLLCNNSRYSQNTGSRIEGFPFPIKLKFFSTDTSVLDDKELIRELIDQVYQFSRMYWKSVKQKSLPVTIEYSELVAEMFSKFESKDLPNFGRNNLWFL